MITRALRFEIVRDPVTGRWRVLNDDVIDPMAPFVAPLDVPHGDDVSSVRVDLRDACSLIHDDNAAARLPWRLRDRLSSA